MGLQKSRTRISSRGLGNLAIRQVEPVADGAFSDIGYLGATVLNDTMTMEEIIGEDGALQDVKVRSQAVSVETTLHQTGKDELDLLRNARDEVHAVRYFGLAAPGNFQYFCFDMVRLNPGISLEFKQGARQLPLKFWALAQDDRDFDVPLYYITDAAAELHVDGLQLWASPRLGLNYLTGKVLDISGYGRHGTISGAASPSDIWKTSAVPERYLSFGANGMQTVVSFGDIGQLNDSDDMLFEVWGHIEAADGTECRIFGRRTSPSTGSTVPGYMLYRDTANKFRFWCTDGEEPSSLVSGNSYTASSGWKHVAVAINRAGASRLYVNGVSDGAPVTLASQDCSTIGPLLLGANATQYGNFSCGEFRVHTFGPNGLPGDIAAIVQRHFEGERRRFGV